MTGSSTQRSITVAATGDKVRLIDGGKLIARRCVILELTGESCPLKDAQQRRQTKNKRLDA